MVQVERHSNNAFNKKCNLQIHQNKSSSLVATLMLKYKNIHCGILND